jgi:hypothetical protein
MVIQNDTTNNSYTSGEMISDFLYTIFFLTRFTYTWQDDEPHPNKAVAGEEQGEGSVPMEDSEDEVVDGPDEPHSALANMPSAEFTQWVITNILVAQDPPPVSPRVSTFEVDPNDHFKTLMQAMLQRGRLRTPPPDDLGGRSIPPIPEFQNEDFLKFCCWGQEDSPPNRVPSFSKEQLPVFCQNLGFDINGLSIGQMQGIRDTVAVIDNKVPATLSAMTARELQQLTAKLPGSADISVDDLRETVRHIRECIDRDMAYYVHWIVTEELKKLNEDVQLFIAARTHEFGEMGSCGLFRTRCGLANVVRTWCMQEVPARIKVIVGIGFNCELHPFQWAEEMVRALVQEEQERKSRGVDQVQFVLYDLTPFVEGRDLNTRLAILYNALLTLAVRDFPNMIAWSNFDASDMAHPLDITVRMFASVVAAAQRTDSACFYILDTTTRAYFEKSSTLTRPRTAVNYIGPMPRQALRLCVNSMILSPKLCLLLVLSGQASCPYRERLVGNECASEDCFLLFNGQRIQGAKNYTHGSPVSPKILHELALKGGGDVINSGIWPLLKTIFSSRCFSASEGTWAGAANHLEGPVLSDSGKLGFHDLPVSALPADRAKLNALADPVSHEAMQRIFDLFPPVAGTRAPQAGESDRMNTSRPGKFDKIAADILCQPTSFPYLNTEVTVTTAIKDGSKLQRELMVKIRRNVWPLLRVVRKLRRRMDSLKGKSVRQGEATGKTLIGTLYLAHKVLARGGPAKGWKLGVVMYAMDAQGKKRPQNEFGGLRGYYCMFHKTEAKVIPLFATLSAETYLELKPSVKKHRNLAQTKQERLVQAPDLREDFDEIFESRRCYIYGYDIPAGSNVDDGEMLRGCHSHLGTFCRSDSAQECPQLCRAAVISGLRGSVNDSAAVMAQIIHNAHTLGFHAKELHFCPLSRPKKDQTEIFFLPALAKYLCGTIYGNRDDELLPHQMFAKMSIDVNCDPQADMLAADTGHPTYGKSTHDQQNKKRHFENVTHARVLLQPTKVECHSDGRSATVHADNGLAFKLTFMPNDLSRDMPRRLLSFAHMNDPEQKRREKRQADPNALWDQAQPKILSVEVVDGGVLVVKPKRLSFHPHPAVGPIKNISHNFAVNAAFSRMWQVPVKERRELYDQVMGDRDLGPAFTELLTMTSHNPWAPIALGPQPMESTTSSTPRTVDPLEMFTPRDRSTRNKIPGEKCQKEWQPLKALSYRDVGAIENVRRDARDLHPPMVRACARCVCVGGVCVWMFIMWVLGVGCWVRGYVSLWVCVFCVCRCVCVCVLCACMRVADLACPLSDPHELTLFGVCTPLCLAPHWRCVAFLPD